MVLLLPISTMFDEVRDRLQGTDQPYLNTSSSRNAHAVPPAAEQREMSAASRPSSPLPTRSRPRQAVTPASRRSRRRSWQGIPRRAGPTEADLARHEGRDYEAASVLLNVSRGAGYGRAVGRSRPLRAPRAWRGRDRSIRAAEADVRVGKDGTASALAHRVPHGRRAIARPTASIIAFPTLCLPRVGPPAAPACAGEGRGWGWAARGERSCEFRVE